MIKPHLDQGWWFWAGLGLLLVALLAALVLWRMQSLAQKTRSRIEAQVEERERIARELHDTLLQGVQGLVMRFQAVAEILPPDSKARKMMVEALERSDDILIESRDRVRNLRAGGAAGDLVARLKSIVGNGPAAWHVSGHRRDVCSDVVEEIAAIAGEALANAMRHAHARHVSLGLAYRFWSLRVEIADDGIGIDPMILRQGWREGHFGLVGMRERAERLGSRLKIHSRLGHGTRVTLLVPRRVAYHARWKRPEIV